MQIRTYSTDYVWVSRTKGLGASERGEIILGGCMVFPHQEDYGCLDCNHRWSLDSLPAKTIKKMRIRVFEQGLCTIDNLVMGFFGKIFDVEE